MDKKEKIKFFGTKWCPDCFRAQRFLDQNNMQYELIDIDKDQQAREFVIQVNKGNRSVPTIVFPDGSILVEPSNQELMKKIEEMKQYP